jgi:trans-aconitate methyltransferase
VGWHAHHPDVFTGSDAFFGPGYAANLVPTWLPALDGVVTKLQVGGRVADVGCGLGASSVILAQAYPVTTIDGSDSHSESIHRARKRAADAAVADRVNFTGGIRADIRR